MPRPFSSGQIEILAPSLNARHPCPRVKHTPLHACSSESIYRAPSPSLAISAPRTPIFTTVVLIVPLFRPRHTRRTCKREQGESRHPPRHKVLRGQRVFLSFPRFSELTSVHDSCIFDFAIQSDPSQNLPVHVFWFIYSRWGSQEITTRKYTLKSDRHEH